MVINFLIFVTILLHLKNNFMQHVYSAIVLDTNHLGCGLND